MANKLHGWRVTHHARAPQFTPPTGGDGLAASGSGGGLSPLLGSRIELGVLLGAGSFGRVYKGRWQGERGGHSADLVWIPSCLLVGV